MKKYIFFFLSLIIILSLSTAAFVDAGQKLDHILIKKYEEDVTGDGVKESLNLYGDLLSANSNYYHNLYVIIKTNDNKKWKIHYNGGYDPSLTFIDFTHNDKMEMLFQSMKVDASDIYHNQLHTITNSEVEKIELPNQNAKGMLQDNFQATIEIPTQSESTSLNLQKYKEKLIDSQVYNKDGTVSKKKNLPIDSSHFYKPVVLAETKGYSLKSYQSVKNPISQKRLGIIETLWYYKNNKWIIIDSNWKDKI